MNQTASLTCVLPTMCSCLQLQRSSFKNDVWIEASTEKVGLKIHPGKTQILSSQSTSWRQDMVIDNITVEMLTKEESTKHLGQKITFQQQDYQDHVDRTPTHNTHLCSTVWSQARKRTPRAWLKSHGLHFIFVRLKRICHLVRTCLTPCCSLTCFFPRAYHLPHSLFFHNTRTRSTIGTTGSTPRTPSATCTCPISPSRQAAPSRITLAWKSAEWRKRAQNIRHRLWAQRAGDCPQGSRRKQIHINCMMYRRNLEKEDHGAPITEEVKELGEIGTAGSPNSKISETSYIQSKMRFNDSLESIADSSKMENYKRCWLHHCMPRKLWKPAALFSSEQGNLTRSSVHRNANPSNLRGSLLEGNKDHLLNQARSDLANFNKCIDELQRQTEEQRLALQDAQYGFVESGREQVRLQEELSMKEKFSEMLKSEMCTKW